MWNMYALDGPHTSNNTEGWHSRIRNLAGKAHPNIYEAVELFKAEQTATEVNLMQLAAGGLAVRRRRKYQRHEKRLLTIKKNSGGLRQALDIWTSIVKTTDHRKFMVYFESMKCSSGLCFVSCYCYVADNVNKQVGFHGNTPPSRKQRPLMADLHDSIT